MYVCMHVCMHDSCAELSSCSSGNKCLLKVALYSAQLEKYSKAISIYEEVIFLCAMFSVKYITE